MSAEISDVLKMAIKGYERLSNEDSNTLKQIFSEKRQSKDISDIITISDEQDREAREYLGI